MKNTLLLCLYTVVLVQITSAQNVTSQPFVIGEQLQLYSKILEENRLVNIYLPEGYHKDSLKTYPVIYLLDGSRDEDFIHIAGLVQFCSFSWIQTIPKTIVVGISNVDRKRDFTFPSTDPRDQKEFPTTGKAASFINFIETELIPTIEKNYAVNDTSSLIGQSLGGLLATEILLLKPGLFDNYFIISPSLWWSKSELLSRTNQVFKTDKKVFVGVGKEGQYMEKYAKDLFEKLKSNSPDNANLFFEFFPERDHGDVLHEAIYRGFELIFN